MESKSLQAVARFSSEKMQKVSLFDSPKYFCDLYCLEPGQEQRVHRHRDSDKIYYVIKGEGLFHIGGEERRLGEGETVIARPGQDHGVRNESSGNLLLLVFMTPQP